MGQTSNLRRTRSVEIGAAERALLVQVIWGRMRGEEAAESLSELERLADTAGAVVIGSITNGANGQRPTSTWARANWPTSSLPAAREAPT